MNKSFRSLVFVAFVIFSVPLYAFHNDETWVGGGTTNNWSDPGNWTGATSPPTSNDFLHFAGSSRTTNTNDFSGGFSVDQVLFDPGAASFTLGGNNIGFFDVANPRTNLIQNNSTALQTLDFLNNSSNGAGIVFGGVSGGMFDAASGDIRLNDLDIEMQNFFPHQSDLTFTGDHDITLTAASRGIFDSFAAGGITKNGSGTLFFPEDNNYSGGTTINDGTLQIGSANSLGVPAHFGFMPPPNQTTLNGGTLQTTPEMPLTFNVPGDFVQTGGTLRMQLGSSTTGVNNDLMMVHNAVNLGPGSFLFLHRVDTYNPNPGDQVTIIQSVDGVTGTFSDSDPVASDFPGVIQPTAEYFGDHVDIVFELGSFAGVTGLTPNQEAVAEALDEAFLDECLPLDVFGLVGNLGPVELAKALDLIAPEELSAIYTMSFSYATVRTDNLIRRMDDIQVGAAGYCPAPVVQVPTGKDDGKNVAMGGKNVVAPVVEPQQCRWGFFINGTGDFVEVDGDFNAEGYDTETGSLIAGADYRIGDHFAIGIDGGYVGGDANLVDDGHIQMRGARLGGYATVFGNLFGFRVHLDGAADGGWNSYDTKRAALSSSNFPESSYAQGDTDGSEFNAMISTGTDWTMFGCLNIATWSTLQYSDVSIDGFTEHGSLIPLHINGHDEESIRGTTGVRLTYDWKFGQTIFRPEARVAWFHEYGDRALDVKANFIDCPTSFAVHGPETGRDAALVSGGFTVQWSGCLATYVHYDGIIGRENYNSGAVSGGLRVGF